MAFISRQKKVIRKLLLTALSSVDKTHHLKTKVHEKDLSVRVSFNVVKRITDEHLLNKKNLDHTEL